MSVELYHVFTDAQDYWYYDYQEEQAIAKYEELCKDHANVRLFWELSEEDGATIEEDCLEAQGSFPW